MTTSSSNQILKYTGLDYSSILTQMQNKMKADPTLDNFRESSIAKTLLEMMAGAIDFCNYYIERQAEESFFETMKKMSSAILKSRDLAYIVTRPIPAEANISISLKGYFYGIIQQGYKLQIPVQSPIIFDDINMVFKKGFTYTFTTEDCQNAKDDGNNFELILTQDDDGDPITLVEGTLKERIILGSTNIQVGSIFQTYRISDTTISNIMGDVDFDIPITRIWVGDKTDANEYTIDRRSLINATTIQGVIDNDPAKCCLVRTAVDQGVDIIFGNAKIAEMGADIHSVGPSTTFDDIYFQYLSTIGSKANRVGVIGDYLTYSSSIILNDQNVTDKITFKLTTNIVGGANIESIDSIKASAPAIFYSLERLINKSDYITYLKTLTSPINVKNALAWGEQEEAKAHGVTAIQQLFNVIMFSCVGDLYIIEGDSETATYEPRTNTNRLDESLLDTDYDENSVATQSYFNVYSKNDVAAQLKEYVYGGSRWAIRNYATVTGDTAYSLSLRYPSAVSCTIKVVSTKFVVSATSDIVFDLDISGLSSSSQMSAIATKLQTALRAITDDRSVIVNGVETNTNLNSAAFPGIVVSWDNTNLRFVIVGSINDACYLDRVYLNNELVKDLGLHAVSGVSTIVQPIEEYYTTNRNYLSSEIDTVLDLLNTRSQITTKHVYISPIIQGFDLSGKIYVKQLFDKEDVRRKANNAIYEFMNQSADYNVEVIKSNLIEAIESTNGVSRTDVSIVPRIVLPTESGRTTFFYPVTNSYSAIDKYGSVDANKIYTEVFSSIYKYYGVTIFDHSEPYVQAWVNFISASRLLSPDEIFVSSVLKVITERSFITSFAKDFYDRCVSVLGASTSTITRFQDTADFLTVLSDIHKDLSWAIRSNMIDENGNLAAQYNVVVNDMGSNTKIYVRGGYTIGTEIPKITVIATYEYK